MGWKGWHGLRNHKRLVSKSDKKNKVEGELICIDWMRNVLWADSSLRDHWRERWIESEERKKGSSNSIGMGDLEKGILARTGIGCKAKSKDVKASNKFVGKKGENLAESFFENEPSFITQIVIIFKRPALPPVSVRPHQAEGRKVPRRREQSGV